MKKYDIVSIVFEDDLLLQELQILSVYKLFDVSNLDKYYIVINSCSNSDKIHQGICDFIRKYEIFGIDINFINARDILGITDKELASISGWLSQQCIKLAISSIVKNQNYLLLDAKNHFIRSSSFDDFIRDEKPVNYFTHISPPLKDRYISSLKLFDVECSENDLTFPTITPYFIITQCCQNMIEYLYEKFHDNNLFNLFKTRLKDCSEFYLYYGFMKKFKILDMYSIAKRNSITLFTAWPQDHEIVKRLIKNAIENADYKVFGLHRKRIVQLDSEEKKMITELWKISDIYIDGIV